MAEAFKNLLTPACMGRDACGLFNPVLQGCCGEPDEALKIEPVRASAALHLPWFLPCFMCFPEVPMVEKVYPMTKGKVERSAGHGLALGWPRRPIGLVSAWMGRFSGNISGLGKGRIGSVAMTFVQSACQGVKQIT